MDQQIVTVDGIQYVITEPATGEIFESTVMGVSETIKTLNGKGYQLNGDQKKLYEIEWLLDGDLNSDDFTKWVKDWHTADAALELD
ncbi:hypothetical protein HC026_02130 [Lactobacillus sp. LC28-10]|uniref:Phage protein n=1 Tax=Secundilactobacillus angelensis TaxID=2722706 RepID=A0ABX1KUU8_9LACO|nr:hypothetical protein [Secundilactobacillus angelensis]MCH5461474.1 hypothetical protein [Secundilactobacillus angelensis]NLR17713.1 hypothetical protein [Secundilactobacillus angelensis]